MSDVEKIENANPKLIFNEPDNTIFIYKEGLFGSQGVSFNPTPLVGISTSAVTDKSRDSSQIMGTPDTFVTLVHTITLEGHFVGQGSTGAASAASILSQAHSKTNSLAIKDFTLEINNPNGQLIRQYKNCTLESFDLEVGNHVNVSRFSATIRSVEYADPTYNIETFAYDFSISSDSSMGYFSPGGSRPSTSSHLIGTETITVVANNSIGAINYAKTKAQYASGGNLTLDDTGLMYRPVAGGGYRVANIEDSSSTNATEGSVTYSVSFILMPDGYESTVIGSVGVQKQSRHDQVEDVGVVNGSLQGVGLGLKPAFNELTHYAYTKYQTIKSNATTLLSSVAMSNVRADERTENISRNYGTGAIDFTLEYDNRDAFQITGAAYEKIEVTDNPSRQVFAVIPVMGRATGPVLQDTYSKTEKRKDVSVEVIFYAGQGGPDGGNALSVINSYTPNGNVSFESDFQTQWNSSERRFTATKSWVYE